MKLIHDVLRACGYTEAPAFSLADPDDLQEPVEQHSHLVTPFYTKAASQDAYLVIPVAGAELPLLLEGNFLSSVMLALGRQEFYSPDMDRNTTLLLLCRREEGEQIDHNAKVAIEDDPYYFKKYVFTFTEQEAAAAIRYIDAHHGSLLEIIRTCLMDTTLFSKYKDYIAENSKKTNADEKKAAKGRKKTAAEPENTTQDNQSGSGPLAYSFFVELAAKITVLPIHPAIINRGITSIAKYWEDELQKIEPIDVDALTSLLDIVPDDKKKEKPGADAILARWQALTECKFV